MANTGLCPHPRHLEPREGDGQVGTGKPRWTGESRTPGAMGRGNRPSPRELLEESPENHPLPLTAAAKGSVRFPPENKRPNKAQLPLLVL